MTRSSELRQDLESRSTSKDPGCCSGRGLTPRPPDRLTGTIQTELSGRMCGLSYTQSNIKGHDLKNGHFIVPAPVVQTLDSAIHRINHYAADSVIDFRNTYQLDSDSSGG